ncbi:actin-related protein 8-like [Vicia villosa]|uniref:actin-related protein 8-like n=1 Tax=Vicia villosa TaxID=3911 RepID=UPI00273B1B50|nr:actin-related protein 8-like [Vicia villosa]
MATLFRKLRDSAASFKRSTTATTTTSNNSSQRSHHHDAPLGLFDSLPSDILLKIIRLLEPKHAAKLCIVCKSWRSLVSDNELWDHFLHNHQPLHYDSIIFSETKLTSGYPLPFFVTQTPRVLSFKHIYGQRERLPPAVIIDGGSGYCKFGWSKEERPLGRTPTFLEFGNVETPIYTRLRHFFGTVYGRMKVKPSSQAVVVSLPICHYDDTESARASRQQLKDAICAALFDLNVPAVCALNQATLALYAAKQTSGISINIGFQVTSVVPILNGKVMRKVGVEVVGLGALKLTGFLREKMQQNSLNFESLYTVRTLKEKLCYVAYDYEAELLKDTQASFEAGEGRYTLSKERFQTGEILFQPRLAGVRAMSLHQATALCVDHCYSAELAGGSDWFKTIVLSGGSACLPGLAERLEKELHSLLPPDMSNGIRVIPPPHGADTAWFGAKLIGSLSTFPAPWCTTKKQFRQKSKLNRIW